jgi:DNA-binding Lrp family transcriptional regulator
MITAIVTLECEVGKVHDVAEALADLDGVAEVYSVSGDYDILSVVRVKEYDELAKVVTGAIAAVPGIRRTRTQMAFRSYSKQGMERAWAETMGG